MYERAFATIAKEQDIPQLQALLGSVFAYHGARLRVYVFASGFSERALAGCFGASPLGSAITVIDAARRLPYARTPDELKRQALLHLRSLARCVCFVDVQVMLLAAADGLFAAAERGAATYYSAWQKRATETAIPLETCHVLSLHLERHGAMIEEWAPDTLAQASAAPIDRREWFCAAGETPDLQHEIQSRQGLKLQVMNVRIGARQRFLQGSLADITARSDSCAAQCFRHFAAIPAPDVSKHPLLPFRVADGVRYAGELSRQDVQVLAARAALANRVLEFGAGASTQVFAQACPSSATVRCVDTSLPWIERTRRTLKQLTPPLSVKFLSYDQWLSLAPGRADWDLVFVDGVAALRNAFALRAWGFLRIGGLMLFHDTRRPEDMENVLYLIRHHYLEVEQVEWNVHASNITCVRKKIREPYVNWHALEALEDRSPGAL